MSSNHSGPKIILCVLALLIVVPNLALAAVASDHSTNTITSSRASSRVLEPCPSSAAGWTVTGVHIYTGTCTISGGAINIQAGADITFEKATLTHSGTYYIYNYAILRIQNSTFTGASGWYGILGTAGMTLLKIENSTVKGYSQYGVRVWQGRSEIGNSTFDPVATSSYGIYCYQATGGFITHNTFKNATTFGMYVYMSPNVWVNNNTGSMAATGSYATYLNNFMGAFDNNTLKGGTQNVLRIYQGAPKSFWHNRANGGAIGLYLWPAITLNAYFCNFSGNTGNDILLTSSAKLKAYDTYFNTSSIASGSTVEVYWRANFSVNWLSSGQGVLGATLNITDAKNNQDPRNLVTDGNGKIQQVYVMEYVKDGTGKKTSSPYWFNASYTSGPKTYLNWSKGNMTNSTNNFPIILDDVAPQIVLSQPNEGYITNQTWAVIKAWTEHNVSKDWPVQARIQVDSKVYNPIIDTNGYIEQNVSLTSDGKHTISIKCIDSDMNIRTIIINVTRDTVSPVLMVTTPVDGALTNKQIMWVNGTTEPGVTLTINGVAVPVQGSGSYSYQYHLVEGDNVIKVRSEDKAHNWVLKVLTVKLDTKAPILAVISPKEGYRTNSPTITIQGTTEAKATLTINNKLVPLFGTSFQMGFNLVEGPNTFTVKSCDEAGNCNETLLHVTLKTTTPSIAITYPAEGYLTNNPQLTVQGTSDAGAKVTVNDHPVTLSGTSFTYDMNLREGKNIIRVNTADDVGNKAETSISVILDTIPPNVIINDPKDNFTTNVVEVTLDGNTEPSAVVSVQGKSVHNSNGAFSLKVALKEGVNDLNVTSVDLAGNKGYATVRVIVDTKVSLKVTGLTTSSQLETTNATFDVTGVADKDATVYVNDYPVSCDKNGNFKSTVQLNLGLNNITVHAEDSIGNKVTYNYQIMRKSPPGPPKPPIIPTSNNGFLGGMLLPIIIIVAVVAALGVGGGLYMRKRSKAKEVQTPPVQPAPVAPAYPQAQPASPPQPQPAQYPPTWTPPQPQAAQYPPPPPPGWYAQQSQPMAQQTSAPQYYQATVVGTAEPAPVQGGISPQATALYEEAQRSIEAAEARGEDMSRQRTHLRVAQTFFNKGNNEKVIYYSNKAMGRT